MPPKTTGRRRAVADSVPADMADASNVNKRVEQPQDLNASGAPQKRAKDTEGLPIGSATDPDEEIGPQPESSNATDITTPTAQKASVIQGFTIGSLVPTAPRSMFVKSPPAPSVSISSIRENVTQQGAQGLGSVAVGVPAPERDNYSAVTQGTGYVPAAVAEGTAGGNSGFDSFLLDNTPYDTFVETHNYLDDWTHTNVNDLETHIADLFREETTLISKNKELKVVVQGQQQTVSDLNAEVEALKLTISKATNANRGLEDARKVLQDENAATAGLLETAKSDLASAQQANTQLSQLRDTLQSGVDSLAKEVSDAQGTLQTTNTNLAAAEARVTVLEGQLIELSAASNALSSENSALKSTNVDLDREKRDLEGKVSKAASDLEGLNTQTTSLTAENVTLNASNQELEGRVSQLTAQSASLQEVETNLQDQIQQLEGQLESKASEYDELSAAKDALNGEVKRLEREKSEVDAALVSAREQFSVESSALNAQIQTLQAHTTTKEADYAQIVQKTERIKGELDILINHQLTNLHWILVQYVMSSALFWDRVALIQGIVTEINLRQAIVETLNGTEFQAAVETPKGGEALDKATADILGQIGIFTQNTTLSSYKFPDDTTQDNVQDELVVYLDLINQTIRSFKYVPFLAYVKFSNSQSGDVPFLTKIQTYLKKYTAFPPSVGGAGGP